MAQVRQATSQSVPCDAESAIEQALDAILSRQREDGHWLYELEADSTITAEYILLVHYLGEDHDPELEERMGRYLRRVQGRDGGWPLFHEGEADVSASVKAYFALKMLGDSPDAPHMQRARARILQLGGAENCNVFTRTLLALYGFLPWRSVPMMPVELLLLPRWAPFHISKVSYWSRTVVVPLLVLNSLRPVARNPRGVKIDELLANPLQKAGLPPCAPHQHRGWYSIFRGIDMVLRAGEGLIPRPVRRHALKRAEQFVRERVNGEYGLGAIFPAMVNAVLMFDVLGVPRSDPTVEMARRSIDALLVDRVDESYCQPCQSPVWDTALACHALLEVSSSKASAAAARGLQWLRRLQVLDHWGDWKVRRPHVRPGGWAFQYENAYYPDVDDTAVVAMALHRFTQTLGEHVPHSDPALPPSSEAIERAREWVVGMQSANGGWGAFEPENTHYYLNNIPFADHGALLDPPTADVTARCLSMLAQMEGGASSPEAQLALAYLLDEQEENGSWFGRWGTNYLYGTWSALCALNAAGLDGGHPAVKRAAHWLLSVQNEDGGWGEGGDSYRIDYSGHAESVSTPSQTAWAIMGLMAAGQGRHEAVERGIAYLVETQRDDGTWHEEHFTAVGFPRVFYLRYHGYAHYFLLWVLARYANLHRDGASPTRWGM
ncbi:squalene--hopene cyclase [Pseudoduganella eburnea]|uniref:Squalene--hopene cyclase n=1 Tax=Massilia eburnea TaxID=1776165 RepID=A0A6L6QCV4_9BURK|nr:squalene--hopene cyclase [Massilia eburnea]MTW09921.1 squalene--hopene cyclase [Massilia eburnea]